MQKIEIFNAALDGDDSRLTRAVGPGGIVCVAPEMSSVFLVAAAADGTQSATIAIIRDYGGGLYEVLLPKSFRVSQVRHDGTHFILTSADGRSAHGTPFQFAVRPRRIDKENNPSYEEQVEETFLSTHLLPSQDSPAPADASGERLGEHSVDDIVRGYGASLSVGGEEIWVTFDSAGPEKVAHLLPHVRELLADFEHLTSVGLEFMWNRFADGSETAQDKARFPDEMVPNALVVHRSGDFELHFTDVTCDYYLDGYCPAVVFRADRTPVDITVEA